jgi:hypothetical protein
MHKDDMETSGRTLRWYEWLAFLLLFGLIGGVRAETVYKCTDAQGGIAFQTSVCSVAAKEKVIDVAPPPAVASAPDYGVDRHANPRSSAPRTSPINRHYSATTNTDASYECRTSDGQVFYRHTPCPHSIATTQSNKSKGHGPSNGKTVSVKSTRVSRDEACAQMRRAGSIGRRGHEHDQDVSTYDKNLGRDPCH